MNPAFSGHFIRLPEPNAARPFITIWFGYWLYYDFAIFYLSSSLGCVLIFASPFQKAKLLLHAWNVFIPFGCPVQVGLLGRWNKSQSLLTKENAI